MVGLLPLHEGNDTNVILLGWGGPIITNEVYFSACASSVLWQGELTAERRCLGRRDDRPRDVHTQCVPPGYLPEGLNHRVSDRQPSITCIVFAQIMYACLMTIHIVCELNGPNADVLNGAMIVVRAQRVLPSYLL
jgi:hypothetical protein